MIFKIDKGKDIRTDLIKQSKDVSFMCNGNGTCGKCIIKVIKGYLDINDGDKRFLSEAELKQGYRLACRHQTEEEIEILWLSSLKEGVIESKTNEHIINRFNVDYHDGLYQLKHHDKVLFENKNQQFLGVAVDIGTTTVVLRLISLENNRLLSEKKLLNSQRKYGADVISRIKFASVDGLEALHQAIITDIETSILNMLGETKSDVNDLVRISVSGNNVMNHLFLNINPKPLGSLPFKPVFKNPVTIPANQLFTFKSRAMVHVMGSFSGFVGADIVSGVLSLEALTDEWFLLLDLGTNGEMVLGNKNVLYVTSTAVGPALEGGNISCGMGSVDGAIHIVSIKAGKIQFDTINHSAPRGICGSGIIDLVATIVKSNQVKPNGKFIETKKIDLTEKISFTQKDIREVQYAKSAVRSGIEILIKIAGITYQEIQKVYLSGGLGNNANIESVIEIGLIPSVLKDKVIPSGNTSLSGAIYNLFALEEATAKTLAFQRISKVVNLAEYEAFNEMYVKQFNLEKS